MKHWLLVIVVAVVGCWMAGKCDAADPITQKCFLTNLFAGCQPPQPPINIAPPDPGVSLSNVIRLLQLAKENDLSVQDVVALIQLGRAGEIAGIQPVPQLPQLPQLPQQPQQPQLPDLPNQLPIGGGGQQQIIQVPSFPQAGTIQIVPYARQQIVYRRPATTVRPRGVYYIRK